MILEHITFSIQKECDVCWKPYEEEKRIPQIALSCYADYPEERLNEYEISFSSKGWLIDIEDTVVQEITLYDEIKNVCTNCQQLSISEEPEIQGRNSIIRK